VERQIRKSAGLEEEGEGAEGCEEGGGGSFQSVIQRMFSVPESMKGSKVMALFPPSRRESVVIGKGKSALLSLYSVFGLWFAHGTGILNP
jgi:hypothetical protein